MHRGLQQASSPRLTPEERKRAGVKRSLLILKGSERRRPIRKSGRGATHRGYTGGRRPGPGPHTGGTHTHTTRKPYGHTHVSGSLRAIDWLRAGTKRQGHGRYRRTYCQGGDSDWAALRALRAVEARPGSRPKIASCQHSGTSAIRHFLRSPSDEQQTTIRQPIECAPEASSGGREWEEMKGGFHLEVTRHRS